VKWKIIPSLSDYEISDNGIIRRIAEEPKQHYFRIRKTHLIREVIGGEILNSMEKVFKRKVHQLLAERFNWEMS